MLHRHAPLVRVMTWEGSLVAIGNVVPAALPELPHGDRNPARRHARQHIDQVAVLLPWYLLKGLQDAGSPSEGPHHGAGQLMQNPSLFPHRLCLWPLVQIQDVLALNETAHAACLYDS